MTLGQFAAHFSVSRSLVRVFTAGLTLLLLAACPPQVCSPANCPTGCCGSSGTCERGSDLNACGLSGSTCRRCLIGDCRQGVCVPGVSTGGGTSGGGVTGGGTGGGSAGGLPGGGSAGGRVEGLVVMPESAVVPPFSSLVVSGQMVGASNTRVGFSLLQGAGRLETWGPSAVMYRASTRDSVVQIRAVASANATVSRTLSYTVAQEGAQFSVVPGTNFSTPNAYATGTRQTFAGFRQVYFSMTPFASYVGVEDLEWHVWPTGTIDASGTLTAAPVNERIYAREPSTNVWASTELVVTPTSALPSVAITPAVSTVAPNGVVQLTAMVSSGLPVTWSVESYNGGTVTQAGTYTAPSTPGVYAIVAAAGDEGVAVATVVVR